jgi:hypothetical protein
MANTTRSGLGRGHFVVTVLVEPVFYAHWDLIFCVAL